MPTSKRKTPADIARLIHADISSACFDVAASQYFLGELKDYDCDDVVGSRADDIYNDDDSMSDLLGDKIYEAAHGDKKAMNEIIDELQKLMPHVAIATWNDLRR